MAADPAVSIKPAPFSFTGTIKPTELSWAYRGGLLVVALAMLLLPLVYLSVIALTGAGVWWHLTHNAWWARDTADYLQWRFVGYMAPPVAGTIVTFFMVKPLLARRRRHREPLALDADDHPRLFALIEQICHQVRAPVPSRVLVDTQINASAGFAPHWQSVLQRDLVLTIGLPLVYALSVRELAGVLAHEFGHFAQGSALRLTMVVRGINLWFFRVVHERDAWDWRLDKWSKSRDLRLMLLLLPSRAGVWLSRKVLRVLMQGGQIISSFMTRQMEYDADSYEIKVSGSEAFASTMRQLRQLNAAALDSADHLRQELGARRLPEDLPLFLVTWHRTRPPQISAATGVPARNRLFDTHPSDDDRLAAAAAAAERGILSRGEEPAAGLFRDVGALSREVTRRHYEDSHLLDGVTLVESVASVQATMRRYERNCALATVFDLGIARCHPLRLRDPNADDAPTIEDDSRVRDAVEQFDRYVQQRVKAFVAEEVFHAEYGVFDPARFDLPEWSLAAAESAEREAIERIHILKTVMAPYERRRLQRISRGLEQLALAGLPLYSPANVRTLADALDTAAAAADIALDLGPIADAHKLLTRLIDTSPRPDATTHRRDLLTPVVTDAIARIRHTIAGAPCPVLLERTASTLEEACKVGKASAGPVALIVAANALYCDLLAEACWLALRGEAIAASVAT